MFQSILAKTATMLGAMLFVFALVSMVSGVANAQSGSTSSVPSFGGGSASRVPTPAQIGGGSSTTQFGGGGSSTTQFSGGSSSTQFNGGSSSTQFNGGSNQSFSQNQSVAPNQNCNTCGQTEPVEPPLDCSQCGLPPVPTFNNFGGWQYPQLQPGAGSIFGNRFRSQRCCN